MEIDQIVKLAKKASKGRDSPKDGAIGSNGYGFVFKDLDTHIRSPYIFDIDSEKYCGVGAYREFTKSIQKKLQIRDDSKSLSDLLKYDPVLDLLFVGAAKTIVPTLQFGGIERLFDAWMFVVTLEERMFPATFYWRQSGLSVGGWTSYKISYFLKKRIFLEDFSKLINFTPFRFNKEEQNLFLDALEFALKKVPISDFWGIYKGDYGYIYMGIKNGEPFKKLQRQLKQNPRDSEAERKLEPLLEREFKDEYGESFFIRRVTGMKIFSMEFEKEIKGDNKFFGNATDILDFYNNIVNNKKRDNF